MRAASSPTAEAKPFEQAETSAEGAGAQAAHGLKVRPGSFTAASFISSLSRTLTAANRFLMERLADQGVADLVPSHGDILVHLFSEQPVPMQRLAAAINRDPSTVTALVKKLAAAGYVTTRKAEADKRVTLVSLTPDGEALGAVIDRVSQKLLEVQMASIDTADFETTCRTLAQVRANFCEALDASR